MATNFGPTKKFNRNDYRCESKCSHRFFSIPEKRLVFGESFSILCLTFYGLYDTNGVFWLDFFYQHIFELFDKTKSFLFWWWISLGESTYPYNSRGYLFLDESFFIIFVNGFSTKTPHHHAVMWFNSCLLLKCRDALKPVNDITQLSSRKNYSLREIYILRPSAS